MDSAHAPNAPDSRPARAQPIEIRVVDAARTLAIAWVDGHESLYPFWYLRGLCPCAVCQGHGGDVAFVGEAQGPGPELDAVHEVGHYAMNLTWKDGHKTGIYSLDTLRTLCPCAVCAHTPMGRHLAQLLPPERRDELILGPPAR